MSCSYKSQKRRKKIVNVFQEILDSPKRKPNITWVDQGRELYNSSFKEGLKDNDIEIN